MTIQPDFEVRKQIRERQEAVTRALIELLKVQNHVEAHDFVVHEVHRLGA